MPYVTKWDEDEKYPDILRLKAYKAGIYGALWPKKYGGTPPREFDHFHSLIFHDELARAGSGGLMASCFLPLGWGLLPVIKHKIKNTKMHDYVCRECISGNKTICLAVTEPTGGSNVANIKTTAKIMDDQYYIVNGEKYFISNGINADYITCAVRIIKNDNDARNTGIKSLAFILIDVNQIMNSNGKLGYIYRSKMKTQGWKCGNTTYIIFKNCKISRDNIIGSESNGFVPILSNFNHGRYAIAVTANRYARNCLEDAIKYAKKRHTFGKPLIKHQVIRHKIINMAIKIESTQSLIERVTYLMNAGLKGKNIAGLMGIIKIDASKTMEYCAREASQIFGGRSYIIGGIASRVERIYREICVNGIAEGSTEILNDLIAKQAKL